MSVLGDAWAALVKIARGSQSASPGGPPGGAPFPSSEAVSSASQDESKHDRGDAKEPQGESKQSNLLHNKDSGGTPVSYDPERQLLQAKKEFLGDLAADVNSSRYDDHMDIKKLRADLKYVYTREEKDIPGVFTKVLGQLHKISAAYNTAAGDFCKTQLQKASKWDSEAMISLSNKRRPLPKSVFRP